MSKCEQTAPAGLQSAAPGVPTHLAARAAGSAAATSPRPPTCDHGATSGLTNTTCMGVDGGPCSVHRGKSAVDYHTRCILEGKWAHQEEPGGFWGEQRPKCIPRVKHGQGRVIHATTAVRISINSIAFARHKSPIQARSFERCHNKNTPAGARMPPIRCEQLAWKTCSGVSRPKARPAGAACCSLGGMQRASRNGPRPTKLFGC